MNTSTTNTAQVAILGVPFRGGQPKGGVDKAPTALREAGLEKLAKDLGYAVVDLGDIDAEPPQATEEIHDDASGLEINAKNPRWVGDTNRRTAEQVIQHLGPQQQNKNQDTFLLSLGGDHSIAIGTISGLLDTYATRSSSVPNKLGGQNDAVLAENGVGHLLSTEDGETDLCVVWVDAHADINTPSGSLSGNIHGMPVSFLMRDASLVAPWKIPGFEWMRPGASEEGCSVPHRNQRLNPRKLVYIGLRDVDEAEEEILRQYNIKSYRMPDVRSKGIEKVMEEIMDYLQLGPNTTSRDRLHLSFDIDGLDPGVCPATGTAVEDGLTLEEGCTICEACGKTGRLVSMDLVEVNPALSDEAGAHSTVRAGLSLIQSALSSRPRRRLDA